MSTPQHRMASIRDRLFSEEDAAQRFLWGAGASVCIEQLRNGTTLGGWLPQLAGRSVLVAARGQLAAALALIELDGVARRLILCTPDLPPDHLAMVVANAGVDAIIADHLPADSSKVPLRVLVSSAVVPSSERPVAQCETEWV